MTQGWSLCWFDDSKKRTWPQKIAPAAKRYREKFGYPVGEVHICAARGGEVPDFWDRPDGVSVPVYPDAQPHGHLFLCQVPKREAEAVDNG